MLHVAAPVIRLYRLLLMSSLFLAGMAAVNESRATELWDLNRSLRISNSINPNYQYATKIQSELVRIGCLRDDAVSKDGDWQGRSTSGFKEFAKRLAADFTITYMPTDTYEDVLGHLKRYETTAWVNGPTSPSRIIGDDCARLPVGKSRCELTAAGPRWLEKTDKEILSSDDAKKKQLSLGLVSLRDALASVKKNAKTFFPKRDPVIYFGSAQSTGVACELQRKITTLQRQLVSFATVMAVGESGCGRCRLQQAFNNLRRFARTYPPAKGQPINPDEIKKASESPDLAEKVRFESINYAMIDRAYQDIQNWHSVRNKFETQLVQNYRFNQELYELSNGLLNVVVASLIRNRPAGDIAAEDQPLNFEDDFRTKCRGFAAESQTVANDQQAGSVDDLPAYCPRSNSN